MDSIFTDRPHPWEVGWELLSRGYGVAPERRDDFLSAWTSLQGLIGQAREAGELSQVLAEFTQGQVSPELLTKVLERALTKRGVSKSPGMLQQIVQVTQPLTLALTLP